MFCSLASSRPIWRCCGKELQTSSWNFLQAHETACKFMELHAILWNCMQLIASSWNCMWAHWTACKLMELHARSWKCMKSHETAWQLMELFPSLWKCMQSHEIACKLMELDESSWTCTQAIWAACELMSLRFFISNCRAAPSQLKIRKCDAVFEVPYCAANQKTQQTTFKQHK